MPAIEHDVQLKLEKILLATNFKPESEAATRFAQELAAHFSSKVTVAYVVDLSTAMRSEAAMASLPADESRQTSAQKMERILDKLRDAGIRANGEILEAHNSGLAIVGLAHQLHADAIVMGTESKHGLRKFVAGSCAEDVIRHATCPVFTLGPKAKKVTISSLGLTNILFATDLQHDLMEKAAAALSISKSDTARIHLCHVLGRKGTNFASTVDLQLRAEAALRKLIREPAYEWGCPSVIAEFGDAKEQILQVAKQVNADLIILGARRSTTWFTHLVEGVVDHVLAEAECPVMTICSD